MYELYDPEFGGNPNESQPVTIFVTVFIIGVVVFSLAYWWGNYGC